MDPTKYEIIPGFYKLGVNGQEWIWEDQEGHDSIGRKYSYLLTEFVYPGHSETEIINHFNNKRTWSSLYITMIGHSDHLSKYTAISLTDAQGTRSYMAVATSNQPTAVQTVNDTENYEFLLRILR